MKNTSKPNECMIHPPVIENTAGKILPAPAAPAYNALFFLVEISRRIPDIDTMNRK